MQIRNYCIDSDCKLLTYFSWCWIYICIVVKFIFLGLIIVSILFM